ncbi:MAG: hypothetical protein ACOCM4_02825 [Acetivibrio ethanolgignens]
MSKINAVRLININYNNNAIRISDECFHFNGESTLVSLQNGGGKSVLVQMLTAPFVHKRYRDTKDRPFESYFTTNKPSFILVEWVLEQGAGFVLTGMMVRKNPEITEEDKEGLEIVTIISEYREPCIQDIYHLPVVEKGKKEVILKGFGTCRQLFEGYKKDSSMEFFCYDMGNAAQSRQYFDKLMEYQIHYKEWESIIKKVNLKESGLSDLFSDCRDEKGLVEKWFLEAVENKLNKERDRIKEFQSILEKYVGQYKDNRSKIERRDTIRIFKEQAKDIGEKGKEYEEAEDALRRQENKIASFIQGLEECREDAQKEKSRTLEKLERVKKEITQTEYERLSGEFYQQEEDLRFHTSNRDMLEMEKETLEREAGEIGKRLHLLACAKQQEETYEYERELAAVRQKLWVFRKKEEDLEPERRRLGYQLKCYYGIKQEENRERTEKERQELEELFLDMQKKKGEIENFEEELQGLALKRGSLESFLKYYDQQESSYNKRYEEKLVRNILGVYEPGTLEICQDIYKKNLDKEVKGLREGKKKLEELKEEQKKLERGQSDKREEKIWKQTALENRKKQWEEYDQELEKRRVVLKYLGLSERSLFDTEKVLSELERKLLELSGILRSLEKEEDELLKECEQLTTGRMMELPNELLEVFSDLGIQVVYGMEWLKKNGYSEEENCQLVEKNPFLPYALILSKQELERILAHGRAVYTSFPIPIILREQLESGIGEMSEGILRFSGLSFYVLFNKDLLNEEKLQLLLEETKERINRKGEAIAIRKKEYREYFERKELIKNQKVSEENYKGVKEEISGFERQLELLEEELEGLQKELSETKLLLEKGESKLKESERQVEYQKQRLEDFEELKVAYGKYEENQKLLEKCRKEEHRIQEKKKLLKELLEQGQEKQRTLEGGLDRLSRELETWTREYQRYQSYEKTEVKSVESMNIAELEARYEAVTAHISQELKELEEQEQKAGDRYQKALDELVYLQRKYGFLDDAWLGVSYQRKEEVHQEALLEGCERKIAGKQALWNDEEKRIAVLAHKKEECLKQIQKLCQKEEPLPQEKIQSLDFDAKRNQLEYQREELQKEEEKIKKHIQSYDENLTALAEYSELPLREEVIWEQNMKELQQDELRSLKGILVRDYNNGIKECQSAKEKLVDVLQRMLRTEDFGEDAYRKPLEAMMEVSRDAKQVLKQLETTIQSYDSLMEKLEVDISLVEKEKEKIIELLEDYTREVHENLGKIDHNSTITIRERPIKMLKLQLPNWEENETLYRLRLSDFIDQITIRGIEIFEQNENAQEYFGTQITTKNLYDTAIGLGNVQIRLYKIEAQREYPITWAEVAKNSGGEGFLSAFVILSSLLYYMRRVDTDLFVEKNEGKVLLMDNPFAQTNASHLLKPLMDMAKKTNTQLICLTGLGGESIYNRFDNIYVLNLIAAGLKNGMQYLRSNHLRGNEPDTLELSRIEVMEQQELVF